MQRWAALVARALCAALLVLPLGGALIEAAHQAASTDAWRGLQTEPGLVRAATLSVFTATLSTALALVATLWLAPHLIQGRRAARVQAWLGPLLSVPHAAFAIGMLWLLAPSGWLARLGAVPLRWDTPPDWRALQDGAGLSLSAVLLLKELPFLLWNAMALLQRPDVSRTLRAQLLQGRCLGATPARLWWTVLWPQWAPRLAWPAMAVLAYGLTVVDVALIIGPTAPPTLAVWVWQALMDANPARNAAGTAGAWLLAAMVVALGAMGWASAGALQRWARRRAALGFRHADAGRPDAWPVPHARAGGRSLSTVVIIGVLASHGAVVIALVFGSLAGPWPFPGLWPQSWHGLAWASALQAWPHGVFTATLAAGVAALAVGLSSTWLALTPARLDRWSAAVLMLPLLLPPLLLLAGLYPLALRLHLDGRVAGLVWAHALMVLPYVHFVLVGPWRSQHPRYEQQARLLGHGPWTVWWRVRVPLMRRPLAAAWGVGFAVSVAQFLPTQFIGAGRLATVTTEAVTLASAGQRAPASALALVQMVLPLLGFALAAAAARERHERPPAATVPR